MHQAKCEPLQHFTSLIKEGLGRHETRFVCKCLSFCIICVPGMVDTIFADVAQPDQARIVAINAHNFLKTGGHVVISIKVSLLVIHVI